MTQAEYDLEMKRLREVRDEEYRKVDQRRLVNAERLHFLLNERKDIVEKIHACHLENVAIETEKNDIARRFNAKSGDLRRALFESIEPKREISGTVAHRLSHAVKNALRQALEPIGGGINIDAIECNYHFGEDGKIDFMVNIPTDPHPDPLP